jgi:peroxiredoxin
MDRFLIPGLITASAVIVSWSWLYWQLLRQNGRILLRLDELEQRFNDLELGGPQTDGLPLGSPAPDFDLADLEAKRKTLSDFRGRSLLLIFFNPDCSFCRDLVPDLEALEIASRMSANRRPLPLIIAIGDAEQSRRLFAQHRFGYTVLLQQDSEVSSAYRVKGTPSGYLIDAEGKIASRFALGAQQLLALANSNRFGNGSLARSKIKRDGLKAGTPAPDFHLPRLDGQGDLSLSDFRGRRVLVVFSSPECEPCNQLAPKLERFHRRRPDVEVIMISKGEFEENRAKVKHGLSFPVVLQQGWTISRSYAIFATPAAYLIDRQGVIVHDVAVGVEPILHLLGSIATGDERESLRRSDAGVGVSGL